MGLLWFLFAQVECDAYALDTCSGNANRSGEVGAGVGMYLLVGFAMLRVLTSEKRTGTQTKRIRTEES